MNTSTPDSQKEAPAVPPRVRIAPSPTGDPHVGTAYIALFNYVFAKKHGGSFVLRIEDTDQTRSHPDSERAILRALRWVGLQWDEGPEVGGPYGPYRQSERADIYRKYAQILIDKGAAYRCFCTPERLAELRKEQQARKSSFMGYDGRCRTLDPKEAEARAEKGEPHVVRLAMPKEGSTTIVDRLRGEVRIDNAQIDDQVLLKSDGFPTYHLANVVDDHLMKITHVIRAEEWITSTPKHHILYEAFGWPAPEWIHMPLLRNTDKSKISKRKNPVSMDYYRDAGFLPEALLNYLGTMGWSISGDRDRFALAEMIEAFTWERVSLGGPVFDLRKLSALNADYLRALSDEEIVARLQDWRFSKDYLNQLVPLVRPRIERLSDFVGRTDFFFEGEVDHQLVADQLLPKKRTRKETLALLKELTDALDAQRDFTPEALEAFGRSFAEAQGWKPKEVFMLLRLAATARRATPPLFETLSVLGPALVRARVRRSMDIIKQLPEKSPAPDNAKS